MVTEREMLSIMDVARLLNMSIMSVYRWVWSGYLPAIKVGRMWMVHPNALEEFARGRISASEEKVKRYSRALQARGMR